MQPPHTSVQTNPKRLEWIGMGVTCCLMVLVGFFRWQFIDLRPVHTDEAENAYLLAKDLSGEGYVFNPKHHHGPTLNLWLNLPGKIMGYQGYADMQMSPLRGSLALLGLATLACFGFFAKRTGMLSVWATIVVAGASGLLTYYGNYVIHETLLGLLVVSALVAMVSFVERPCGYKAALLGLIGGLMFATKMTALIYFSSWCCGAAVLWLMNRQWAMQFPGQKWRSWLLTAVAVGALVSTLLYTSFLSHPRGIWDAIQSLWSYTTESGHGKSWSYFVTDFILPFRQPHYGSYEWAMWGFAGLGLMVLLPLKRFDRIARSTRLWVLFLGVSSGSQLLFYSLVAYKTPWLMLCTWLHVSLLAGLGVSVVWRMMGQPWVRVAWMMVFVALVAVQLHTTDRLNRTYHSDPRNPYAYAPTSVSIERLPAFVGNVLEKAAKPPSTEIAVYGVFTWPVPWYLRTFSKVRYDMDAAARPVEFVVILTDASYAKVDPDSIGQYKIYPFTLRPNVPIYVCVHESQIGADFN